MQFKEIVGQEATKKHLINTVQENRVSHAQLFLGPEGAGALPLAIAYAQYVSCENKLPEDSCGECASCRKYQRLIHPDLHFSFPFFRGGEKEDATPDQEEWRSMLLKNPYFSMNEWRGQLNAENKQPNINKAECLNILRKLSMKPFESEYKALIIWLPEYLKNEGNRLLKSLEEPAPKTLIILVAEQADQLLNTIISRTQLVKVPRLEDQDIKSYLQAEMGLSADQAARAAYLSEGNLHAAIEFSRSEENDNYQLFADWMRMTYADKGSQFIDYVDVLAKLGRENQKNLLRYGINLIREAVLFLSGAEDLVNLPDAEYEFISKFSKIMDLAKAEALIEELEKAHYHVERNANPKILFLDVSLQFVKILKFNTLPQGTHYIRT